jgi:putative transposase
MLARQPTRLHKAGFRNPKEAKMESEISYWHHSPLHIFIPNTAYMVTASTFQKQHIFTGADRLRLLQNALFEVVTAYEWNLQAWAIFSNHYHFIAKSPHDATTLKRMIQRLHSQTSRAVNQLDGVGGRQVWFQYWDTCLTFAKSYYARLNYVHNNAIKHSLTEEASLYPFCSAAWFEARADEAFRKKVASFSYEPVNVEDDFVVV